MTHNKNSAKFRYHAMKLAAEFVLKWFNREDKRTDGECQVMPQLHGQFFAHFPSNLEKDIHWSTYRDVFVFYRLNTLFQQKNEELKLMKKERLERATEEDKRKLVNALDRLASKKPSKSSGASGSKSKKKKKKVEMSSANAKMTVDGGGPRSSRFIMAQKNLGLMLEIIRKDPESYKEA
ncbi:hypothetical protein WR25_11758 [Diploscapter pachys]|uniref:Uncharacterized protein n=1 Tax=Diploscapter pachys TaxID=2018661 RepID=A0A2A2JX42_9BILA|nr:hypothetical protein WR25_11758 [Diploscapter pachys]